MQTRPILRMLRKKEPLSPEDIGVTRMPSPPKKKKKEKKAEKKKAETTKKTKKKPIATALVGKTATESVRDRRIAEPVNMAGGARLGRSGRGEGDASWVNAQLRQKAEEVTSLRIEVARCRTERNIISDRLKEADSALSRAQSVSAQQEGTVASLRRELEASRRQFVAAQTEPAEERKVSARLRARGDEATRELAAARIKLAKEKEARKRGDECLANVQAELEREKATRQEREEEIERLMSHLILNEGTLSETMTKTCKERKSCSNRKRPLQRVMDNISSDMDVKDLKANLMAKDLRIAEVGLELEISDGDGAQESVVAEITLQEAPSAEAPILQDSKIADPSFRLACKSRTDKIAHLAFVPRSHSPWDCSDHPFDEARTSSLDITADTTLDDSQSISQEIDQIALGIQREMALVDRLIDDIENEGFDLEYREYCRGGALEGHCCGSLRAYHVEEVRSECKPTNQDLDIMDGPFQASFERSNNALPSVARKTTANCEIEIKGVYSHAFDAAERLRDSMLGICAIPRVGLHPKKDPTIGLIVHVGADSLIREKSELTYAPHR